jgi:hypothetical protein
MTRETTLSLIRRYYDAFNAGDPLGLDNIGVCRGPLCRHCQSGSFLT